MSWEKRNASARRPVDLYPNARSAGAIEQALSGVSRAYFDRTQPAQAEPEAYLRHTRAAAIARSSAGATAAIRERLG
jgi:hypothetical protein